MDTRYQEVKKLFCGIIHGLDKKQKRKVETMTSAQDLRMREPALAMLMGAVPEGQVGFGDDYGFGYGGYHPGSLHPYEPYRHHHWPYAEYLAPPPPPPQLYDDYDYGYGFGAPPEGPAIPPPAVHPGVHHGHHGHHGHHPHYWMNPASTGARTLLLDPNRDSIVKVERYSFSFSPSPNLILGAASNIMPFTQQPSTSIKGQRVIMNAPVPGFVLISSLQVANVNVLVGGTEDAFTYSAGAMGVVLDLPRLDPQNRATAAGAYTGVLPPGYTQGATYQFVITLQGPSTLAGGYGQ